MDTIIVDDNDIIQETSVVEWAKGHQVEAEQLAMDAARLLSCTEDRLEEIKNQGFFSRCWSRLTGKAREMEQANKEDLLQIQKISMQYLTILEKNSILLAQDMVILKNQLLGLSIKEEETRNLITQMAYRTAERFRELEDKIGQIEVSSKLQGWVLGLEERDYNELYPNKYSRMFRVINDFYSIKNDNWSYNDIILMRKALRFVDIDPKEKTTLESFISSIVDEIEEIGISNYSKSICKFNKMNIEYSNFVINNISSPIFSSIHNINIQYVDKSGTVKALHSVLKTSRSEALKILIKSGIEDLNIKLNYEFPLIEAAIEILGCLRLVDKLNCKNIIENNNAERINNNGTYIIVNIKTVDDILYEKKSFIELHNKKINELLSENDILKNKALDTINKELENTFSLKNTITTQLFDVTDERIIENIINCNLYKLCFKDIEKLDILRMEIINIENNFKIKFKSIINKNTISDNNKYTIVKDININDILSIDYPRELILFDKRLYNISEKKLNENDLKNKFSSKKTAEKIVNIASKDILKIINPLHDSFLKYIPLAYQVCIGQLFSSYINGPVSKKIIREKVLEMINVVFG